MTQVAPAVPLLYSRGHELDPECVGLLHDSSGLAGDFEALRRRMREDGYLFLPGYLDRDEVLAARREMVGRLAREGYVQAGTDPMEAIASDKAVAFYPDLAKDNAPLRKLLYSGRMMEFYTGFLGSEVRHFDYTWIRAVSPGPGTPCHCDIVYMGRGTHNLYTSWTPLGDVGFDIGGLMILEGSSRNPKLRHAVENVDVDSSCANRTGNAAKDMWSRGQGGWFKAPPPKLRNSMGGRWLTSEYRMGDVLIFGMFTLHASLDNRSDRIRLSSDTRYQLASEPADERWIGENPIAHGPAGKRSRVC